MEQMIHKKRKERQPRVFIWDWGADGETLGSQVEISCRAQAGGGMDEVCRWHGENPTANWTHLSSAELQHECGSPETFQPYSWTGFPDRHGTAGCRWTLSFPMCPQMLTDAFWWHTRTFWGTRWETVTFSWTLMRKTLINWIHLEKDRRSVCGDFKDVSGLKVLYTEECLLAHKSEWCFLINEQSEIILYYFSDRNDWSCSSAESWMSLWWAIVVSEIWLMDWKSLTDVFGLKKVLTPVWHQFRLMKVNNYFRFGTNCRSQ